MDDKDFELNKNALNAREESVAESVEGGSGLSVEKISVTEDTRQLSQTKRRQRKI